MAPTDDDPSRRLVELIKAGTDVEANFGRLHQLHVRRIRSFFLQRGFSPEETADLTQDVFLRVYRGIPTFRLESGFKTWLFEIADHVFQNELRRRGTGKRKGWETSIETGGPADEEGQPTAIEPPVPPTALKEVLERERTVALSESIRDLPEQMRTCFLLRYGQERKYREIAVIMRITIDTVKAHLFQAKKRLKLELAELSED
ncbi:MAG TPA: RNA polymerase sigma factor [Thermoanaerobaculia bacterium]|nr:RNA polymerase sigma factor [Thermoanaerobaculia bacterium]